MMDKFFGRLPVKGGPKGELLFKVLFCAALFIVIVSGAVIGIYHLNALRNQKLNKGLISEYHSSATPESAPASPYPAGMLPDFYKLYDTNPDIRGWITIPNTVVNYPVLQSGDNSYYLSNNINRTADEYGSLFVDYRDQVEVQSRNMIIYGHNMKDGQMFHSIVNYQLTDFYNSSPIITFNTVYGKFQWKVFAAFIANADPNNGYVFNYLVPDFSSEDDFQRFVDEVRKRSLINTPSVDIRPGDTLLTLSTCYYSFDNARFVVMARRVRPDESLTVGPAARNKDAVPATSPAG